MSRKRRGRGEGAVFQRSDGLWVGSVSVGYDDKGKRRRRTIYGPTKQDAQKKLRELQADESLLLSADTQNLTLAEFLATWLENTARVKVGASTYDRYRMIVNKQIKPNIGGVRLNKLAPFHVMNLDSTLEKANESRRTRQMTLTVLHTAMRCAVRAKLLPANPCADVARPKVTTKEMTVWAPEQVRSFLRAVATDRLSALFTVAIDTGMRQGELFGLQWSDIDFEVGTLQIQRNLSELRGKFVLKPPKTAAGRRRIVVSTFALDALHDHRKRMLAEGRDVRSGHVFVDERGGYLRKSNFTRRTFRAAMNDAGVPRIRFHDLRHTAASLLLMSGENPKVVSERLGHNGIEITLKTYSHVLPTMQTAAAEKMNRLFRAAEG